MLPSPLPGSSLFELNRVLAKEWHPTKNGSLTPKDVSLASNKKIWWMCDKGHEWETSVNNRSKDRGCPYCAGVMVCNDNCLQTLNPKLARQWHPTKNGSLTPRDVTPGSEKKIWWRCENNHEWQSIVYNRGKGVGCPLLCRQSSLQR